MKPSRHIIASACIGGALAFFTKSVYAGIICFASGIFVDFDHVIEYIIHHKWKNLSFRNVYYMSEQTSKGENGEGFKKLYLVFHIGEIALLLWVAAIYTKNIYLLAISLGYSAHIVMDSIGNTMEPAGYFVLWRAMNKFDTERLMKKGLRIKD
ncbi:MAG: hypothetical protein WBC74_05900 [Candidatus Omnitrophota bacterium]